MSQKEGRQGSDGIPKRACSPGLEVLLLLPQGGPLMHCEELGSYSTSGPLSP